jgi:TMEM175 potassium channel family protein
VTRGRLEAFSDGVIAIIITIMVLELRPPEGSSLRVLLPLFPSLLTYLLSFIYLGIYWNNHHHLFQAVQRVNGSVLWANMHLLFWLSLVPFVTGWMGDNGLAPVPVALYGAVMLLAAVAYYILVRVLVVLHGAESTLATSLGSDTKGKISLAFYTVSIPLAFVSSILSIAIFVIVALIWLVPDQRIENTLASE